MSRFATLFLLALLACTSANTLIAQHSSKPTIPPTFIQNQGQWSPEVRFMAQVGGMNVWLTEKGLMYDVYQSMPRVSLLSDALGDERCALPRVSLLSDALGDKRRSQPSDALGDKLLAGSSTQKPRASLGSDTLGRRRKGHVIAMELVGANLKTSAIGTDAQPSTRNYFIGNNPSSWRTNIPSFGKVITRDVYPGIDAVYTFSNGKPRYDFVVHPGAEPDAIALKFTGADAVKVSKQNGVELSTSVGTVINGNIYAYQEINGRQLPVACSFAQQGEVVKFDVGAYNSKHLLIIDPLVYSTYYGGTGIDEITGMKLDTAGNVVVTGVTGSPNFPTKVGSYDSTANGGTDAFVAKFDKTLNTLLFATFIGGKLDDKSNAIAINHLSNTIYIAGETTSDNLPTESGAWKPTYSGGGDAFVARLSENGSTLQYCTYVGGSKDDRALGICVDDAGKATICGETNSTNFPTGGSGTYQKGLNAKYDAFLTKLKPAGLGVDFSTYLGGSGDDRANAVACDGGGSVIFFAGETKGGFDSLYPYASAYWNPATYQGYNGKFNSGGFSDGFVGEMSGSGSFTDFSKHFLTYIGDAKNDRVLSLLLLPSGDVVVAGETEGGAGNKGFPTSTGNSTSNGGVDCFLSKFTASGKLTSSIMLGGSGNEGITSMYFNPTTSEYIVGGTTTSANFPQATVGGSPLPEKASLSGTKDGFVCRLPSSSDKLSYFSYIGGRDDDGVRAVVGTPRGDMLVAGYTASSDMAMISPAFQLSLGGGLDGFISKIAFGTVTLTAPNGGAVYCPGETTRIAWSKGEGLSVTENMDIELSSDGGITWTSIAKQIPGTEYGWKIPVNQTFGTNYKIRILHPSSGIRDESDASFSVGSSALITEQPVGDSVCAGDRAVFRVKGTGTNLTYKWLRNDVELKGETRDSVVIGTVGEKDGGSYRVEVSAGCAPTVSQVAILAVKPATTIVEQPKSGKAALGDSFTFRVGATGNKLRYQWQQDKVLIPGATDSVYGIPSVNGASVGIYNVVVSGDCGRDTSENSTLNMLSNVDDNQTPQSSSAITIVPNPITDKMQILGGNGNVRVYLYTSLGMLATEQVMESGTGEMEVAGLPNGVYSVQVHCGTRILTKQVVVLR